MTNIKKKKSELIERIIKVRHFNYQPFSLSKTNVWKTAVLKLDGNLIVLEGRKAKSALDSMKKELEKQPNEQFKSQCSLKDYTEVLLIPELKLDLSEKEINDAIVYASQLDNNMINLAKKAVSQMFPKPNPLVASHNFKITNKAKDIVVINLRDPTPMHTMHIEMALIQFRLKFYEPGNRIKEKIISDVLSRDRRGKDISKDKIVKPSNEKFKPYVFTNPTLSDWEERFENLLKGIVPEQAGHFSVGPMVIDTPEQLNQMAIDLLRQGVSDVPIGILLMALEKRIDFHIGWMNLGSAFSKLGLVYRAITCYQKTIEYNPDYYVAWLNLASTYILIKNFDSAIKTLEEVLGKKPEFKEAWLVMADIYKILNNPKKRQNCLDKAAKSQELLGGYGFIKS